MPRRYYYPSHNNAPPPYEQPATRRDDESSDASFDGVITAINNLGTQVGNVIQQQTSLERSFQTFRENLPDKFMPRTELNERLSTLEHADNALNARMVAMEEWRLSQTQRENDRLMQMQQQTFQVQSSTQQQISAVQQNATHAVSDNRTQIDGRLINILYGVVVAVIGWLLGHGVKW